MKKAGAIIAGLLIALVGQFLGLGLAGAGHGWNTAFWVSTVLWLAYPVTVVRAADALPIGRPSFELDWPLVVLALLSDVALVVLTKREGVEYFWKVVAFDGWGFVGPWIVIWVAWQVPAAINLIRALGRRA